MNKEQVMGKVENILFAAGDSMEINVLAEALGVESAQMHEWMDEEIARRQESGNGLIIRRFEDRVQLATRPEEAELLFSLFGEKGEEELTRAMMETLSIIAYRQPVTRGEIEELRGVNTSYVLSVLLDKGLVYEAGRKEAVGRPILYATSEGFLRHFGLESISQLPALPEV
ncbi:MAG: SMC-Scp complex subunit ScpB [Christensenellaceae bacterium]|nr:SMC-Scp complex subunit ScpB [Christensenellaceae bacterium]